MIITFDREVQINWDQAILVDLTKIYKKMYSDTYINIYIKS